MSITTALKARREQLRDREAGFTLIELLVVVIIIGILAAIAIPIYIGVQNNAKDSAVKSDLTTAKTAVAAYYQDNSSSTTLPALTSAALKNYGFALTANNYTAAPSFATGSTVTNWCIDATSTTGKTFAISLGTSVANTTCATLTSSNW